MSPHGEYGRVDPPGDGAWLPLTDALRETATVNRIVYRLIGDGKLRSREGADGEIEVWVRDEDRVSDPTPPTHQVADPVDVTVTAECTDLPSVQATSLLAPLAASYERNIQLAYENGSLKERTAMLDHELRSLRSSSQFDKRALQHMTERLRTLESRQAEMYQPMSASDARAESKSVWWLVSLVPGVALCLGVAVTWLLRWPLHWPL
jgi:hypothetical protein